MKYIDTEQLKTASDIKQLIKQKTAEGFKADLVIVDYFGCVKPDEYINTRENDSLLIARYLYELRLNARKEDKE